MAHLQEHRPGRFRIRFYLEGRHDQFCLPKIPRKQARAVLEKVDRLIECRLSGEPPGPRIVEWLANVGDEIHGRLVSRGLTHARVCHSQTLKSFLDEYISEQTTAAGTIENLRKVAGKLVAFFGADIPLRNITRGDADRFRRSLKSARATNALTLRLAKQFFRAADRLELITASPFDEIKAGGTTNKDRQEFIDRERFHKVLEKCTDLDTRTCLALNRYGGLRHTSETFKLKITDIHWDLNQIAVDSSKTGLRHVPIFPELKPFLNAAFDAAPDGAKFLIQHRVRGTIRARFQSAQRAAGVGTWEREFHNMRSSRQTELQRKFPADVVTGWMGNSKQVADDHYLQTLSEDYERAATITTEIERAPKCAPK